MATAKPVFGAFDKGQIPTIACFNQATIPLGVDFDKLIAAKRASFAREDRRGHRSECRGRKLKVTSAKAIARQIARAA